MVSRNVLLNVLLYQRSNGKRDNSHFIQLDKLPGGTKTFLLLVKFCYGWRVDLMASDFLSLYYVAHSSGISDDIEQGNLIMYCPKPRIF